MWLGKVYHWKLNMRNPITEYWLSKIDFRTWKQFPMVNKWLDWYRGHVLLPLSPDYTVNPQLSEPRLSGSQNHLARDTWIMQLSHQRTYTVYTVCAFSVTRVFSLFEDGRVATNVNVCMSTCMCICTMLYLIVFHLSEQNVCGIWPMGFG